MSVRRQLRRTTCCLAVLLGLVLGVPVLAAPVDEATAGRFAELALGCVHREYPNKIAHVLRGDEDALPPRQLTPAFYGCFDWHSSVHGHWLLARLASSFPEAEFAASALAALGRSLTPENIAAEVTYLSGEGRAGFERPYGLAWLLQLAAELRQWDEPRAQVWAATLAPLEEAAAQRLREWIPKLTYPIRVGEHSQTAFAFGLILDWARTAGDVEMATLLETRGGDFYGSDTDCPLGYEPSGHDFLSPCLAEADYMRRVLAPTDFGAWLDSFLPGLGRHEATSLLEPAVVSDRSDGKLAHLDGLNLSRAWMLEGIAAGLPPTDARRVAIEATAAEHASTGLESVTGEHYAGGHWLGSFATYLVTQRGLPD